MDIRIKTLTLNNFKGIRSASFAFDGRNVRIEGDNGTGKSTVFDAFTWLLFGKDHLGQDQTTFDIKPIDPQTGEPFHHLEHWVEAVLSVDGSSLTLRREWAETWIKPRGEVEQVMKGHESRFYVNGVNVATKNAYDATVRELVDEGVFKVITNPLYFIDSRYTSWQERRKVVLSLVDGTKAKDALAEEFPDLIAAMNGEPMDAFRKRVAALKKNNRDDMNKAKGALDAYRKALADGGQILEEPTVRANLERLEREKETKLAETAAQLATIDEALQNINEANKTRQAESDALYRELLKVRQQKNNIVESALQKERERRNGSDSNLRKVQFDLTSAMAEKEAFRLEIDNSGRFKEDALAQRNDAASKLARAGQDYEQERDRAFEYTASTVCPACGQPLPAETLEQAEAQARAIFQAQRKERMQELIDKARRLKETIAVLDKRIKDLDEHREQNEALMREAAAKESRLGAELERLRSLPDDGRPEEDIRKEAMQGEDYRALEEKDSQLQADLKEIADGMIGVGDLVKQRRLAEEEKDRIVRSHAMSARSWEDALAVIGERRRLEGLARDEEDKVRRFADELARLERLEFRAGEYTRAMVENLEQEIDSLFEVARWKLFETTQDGAVTEVCEVTDAAGVPYRSMNDAKKILCGMDVIRVLGAKYDVHAPVFIDNAEGITRKDFATPAQVIRLVVKEGSERTLSYEDEQ